MKEFYPILRQCSFFDSIPEEKYPNVLRCLQASRKTFSRNTTILHIGEQSQMAGMILDGTVELVFYDENGNQINVNHISAGEVFGLELACSRQNASPIQLRAVTDCQVLFMDFETVLDQNAPPCPYRLQVASNLLRDFARQTLFLNQKLRILSQKRLRDKIKVYLQSQEICQDGRIMLPFSRSEMADFLYVDRSALSRELSRMQQEGILTYRGQEFCILDLDFLAS